MNYAFFTGMGRSGTKLLATMLNAVNGVQAEHEFIGNREFWLLSWYLPHDVYSETYLMQEKKEIEMQPRQKLFIDVNSMLQNCVPALNKVFNPQAVFHLVRDPRDVVRSLYARRNENNIHLIPKTKEDISKWLTGDKLYQVCWNWKSTTEKLLSENTTLIRLEDVISDYTIFKNKILLPLQVEMPEVHWQTLVSGKVNKTQPKLYRKIYAKLKGKTFVEDELPQFKLWNENKKQILLDVCGETMIKCGYAV